jgi:outer membrane protein OmpA-like peptidoglycan-associated protein
LLTAATTGCAELRASGTRLAALRRSIETVTLAGAYGCAPRELALARAQLEFADIELAQGDPQRAAEHLDEAEENIGAADVLSPKQRCEHNAGPVPDLSATAAKDSDGDGVPDSSDRCPDQQEDRNPGHEADGCSDLDDDRDGIPDTRDACPRQPEDVDGSHDEDGCPDPDNDADGLEDARDACPDRAGPAEQQGCPRKDYPNVTLTERELRLAVPITFEGDSATIRSVSFPTLDTVAELLRDQPRMTLEIGAHTNSQGDDAENQLLSQSQADSVRKYLVEHGVDSARLTSRGYGETRPIESNSTSQGRAINRRIELVRTDRAL